MSATPFISDEHAAGQFTGLFAGRFADRAALHAALGPLAEVTGLLSEPVRLRLLRELSAGEQNVTQLCHALGLPQPTASHHLGLLTTAGLLSRRRNGKMIFYRLGPSARATGEGLEVDAGGFCVRIA